MEAFGVRRVEDLHSKLHESSRKLEESFRKQREIVKCLSQGGIIGVLNQIQQIFITNWENSPTIGMTGGTGLPLTEHKHNEEPAKLKFIPQVYRAWQKWFMFNCQGLLRVVWLFKIFSDVESANLFETDCMTEGCHGFSTRDFL